MPPGMPAPPFLKAAPTGREMLNYIGSLAHLEGVSDPSLNGRSFPIIRAYVDEDKYLLDATEDGGPAYLVRYIKVSTKKITGYRALGLAVHVRAAMLASNRDAAFEDAGMDVTSVWALEPRPVKAVRPKWAFTDVPKLCELLNNIQAIGHPFQLVFGYFVFGETAYVSGETPRRGITNDEATNALYSSEPIVLLKDKRGQVIDVSEDLWTATDPSFPFNIRKIFIEDPLINPDHLAAGMFALRSAREIGFLSSSSYEDHLLQGTGESSVQLGMLPEQVGEVPETIGGCIVHIFNDGGLRGYEKDKKAVAFYNTLADLRRKTHFRASTICSRTLFAKVCLDAAPFEGCLVSADKFGIMCFGCFIRITESEAKLCDGCGKAMYCSAMCQNWHWKEHRAKCASPEERKARREAAAAAASRRAAELAKHDQMVALEKAEEAAKEAVRKHQAMLARAEKAEKEAREYARLQEDKPPLPSDTAHAHRGRNKNKMHKMTVEQQLVHARWTSEQERQDRHEAATLRKQAEHLEAEARKAKKRVDQLKAKISHALKEQAAASHALPTRATVGEALAEAVQCVSIA